MWMSSKTESVWLMAPTSYKGKRDVYMQNNNGICTIKKYVL